MFPFIAKAKVLYVHEPTVYEMLFDLGFEITFKRTVFLKGLESFPTTKCTDYNERERAFRAKRCAIKVLKNRWVLVETYKDRSPRPHQWPSTVRVVGESHLPGVNETFLGDQYVDMCRYLKELEKFDFDESRVDLTSPGYEDPKESD